MADPEHSFKRHLFFDGGIGEPLFKKMASCETNFSYRNLVVAEGISFYKVKKFLWLVTWSIPPSKPFSSVNAFGFLDLESEVVICF